MLTFSLIALSLTQIRADDCQYVRIEQEIPSTVTWTHATVFYEQDADTPFSLAVPFDGGGNRPDWLEASFSRCGRTVVHAYAWDLPLQGLFMGFRMDLDFDAVRTSNDFFLFLDEFFMGRYADYDGDGEVTTADFFGWLECFLQG